jgi:hypothetical protein
MIRARQQSTTTNVKGRSSMPADEGLQAIGGFTRRGVLRGGLLAGAGVVAAGAMSAVLAGTANASTQNPQPDWGYCKYCTTMWWTPGVNDSACAYPDAPDNDSGKQSHGIGSGSYNYLLPYGLSGTNNSNPQPNWRWCTACQGLFWGGYDGPCAAQGAHQPGNTSYDVYFNGGGGVTGSPQAYWRWCSNCSLLYWQGPSGTQAGYCPIGTPHTAGSSTNYSLSWSGTY